MPIRDPDIQDLNVHVRQRRSQVNKYWNHLVWPRGQPERRRHVLPVGRNNRPQKRNVFLSVRAVKAANDLLRKIAGYFVRLDHDITSNRRKTTGPV
jgi:hypothetical protein